MERGKGERGGDVHFLQTFRLTSMQRIVLGRIFVIAL